MFRKSVFIGILVLCLTRTALAEPEEKPIRTVVVKDMQGEVSGISSNFIAILFGVDEKSSHEMAFTMNKDVKVEHKKSLKDIGVGDLVSVNYEEISETTKQDDKDITRVLSREVKRIRFISEGAKIRET